MAHTKILVALLLLVTVLLLSHPTHADLSRAVELYNGRSYADAFREFSVLAQQGNREAQAYLGGMYRDGTGVPQDDAAAFAWYRKAAEQGSPEARVNLGFLSEKGLGCSQSWAEALRWYRAAAEQGHVQAQTNVGYLLQAGLGADRDDPQALQWFQRAADQGSARGMYYIGKFHAEGRGGLVRNPKAAVEWFRRSEQAAGASPVEFERNHLQAARQEREALEKEMAPGPAGVGGALPGAGPAPPAPRPVQPASASAAPVEPISQWKMYESKNSGLAVRHPAGWKVEDRGLGAFRVSGPDRTQAMVLVQPLENLTGSPGEAVQAMGRLFPDVFAGPGVSPAQPLPGNPRAAVAEIRSVRAGQRCVGSALCIKAGSQGMLYAITSEESAWPHTAPLMRQILKSFYYSGSKADRSMPAMVEWVEPTESAFTIPVPSGWPVEGGLRRMTALDLRSEVKIRSPDGKVFFQLGDFNLPIMVLPSRKYLTFTQEGNWSSIQGVQPVFILRYLPGGHFLTDYYLPERLGAIQIGPRRDLPDIAHMLATHYAQFGIRARVDAGEVFFDANTSAGMRKGYWTAHTRLIAGLPGLEPDDGQWTVTYIAGYLCAPEQEPLARSLLAHMISGYRSNPQWEIRELQLQGQIANVITGGNAAINDMIARHQHERAQTMDRAYGHLARSISGQVLVRDPGTGAEGVVADQGNYYWRIRGTDQVFATDSPAPPLVNQAIDRMDVVN